MQLKFTRLSTIAFLMSHIKIILYNRLIITLQNNSGSSNDSRPIMFNLST